MEVNRVNRVESRLVDNQAPETEQTFLIILYSNKHYTELNNNLPDANTNNAIYPLAT